MGGETDQDVGAGVEAQEVAGQASDVRLCVHIDEIAKFQDGTVWVRTAMMRKQLLLGDDAPSCLLQDLNSKRCVLYFLRVTNESSSGGGLPEIVFVKQGLGQKAEKQASRDEELRARLAI